MASALWRLPPYSYIAKGYTCVTALYSFKSSYKVLVIRSAILDTKSPCLLFMPHASQTFYFHFICDADKLLNLTQYMSDWGFLSLTSHTKKVFKPKPMNVFKT